MAIEFKVKLPDEPGSLARLATVLGDADVNINGIHSTSGDGESVVHFVTDNALEATRALDDARSDYIIREVVVLKVLDEPGTLGDVAAGDVRSRREHRLGLHDDEWRCGLRRGRCRGRDSDRRRHGSDDTGADLAQHQRGIAEQVVDAQKLGERSAFRIPRLRVDDRVTEPLGASAEDPPRAVHGDTGGRARSS